MPGFLRILAIGAGAALIALIVTIILSRDEASDQSSLLQRLRTSGV